MFVEFNACNRVFVSSTHPSLQHGNLTQHSQTRATPFQALKIRHFNINPYWSDSFKWRICVEVTIWIHRFRGLKRSALCVEISCWRDELKCRVCGSEGKKVWILQKRSLQSSAEFKRQRNEYLTPPAWDLILSGILRNQDVLFSGLYKLLLVIY